MYQNKFVYIINNKKNIIQELANEIQLKASEIDNTNTVKITCKPTNTTSDYVSFQMKMPILTHNSPFDQNPLLEEKLFYRVSPVYNNSFLGIQSDEKNQGIMHTWFSSDYSEHYDDEAYKKNDYSYYKNMTYWLNKLYAPYIYSLEFLTLSDNKIKENKIKISNSRDILKQLNIYKYNKKLGNNIIVKEIGLIAQDIQKIPELKFSVKKNNELLELNYNNIFCLGLQCIQDLIHDNDNLTKKIQSIEKNQNQSKFQIQYLTKIIEDQNKKMEIMQNIIKKQEKQIEIILKNIKIE